MPKQITFTSALCSVLLAKYYSGDQRRRMRCPGHVAGVGVGRGAEKVLVRKPEGRRPPERSRHTWEDNTKIDLPEEGG